MYYYNENILMIYQNTKSIIILNNNNKNISQHDVLYFLSTFCLYILELNILIFKQ